MAIISDYAFTSNANDIIGGYNGTVTGATLKTERVYQHNGYLFDGTTAKYITNSDSSGYWNGKGTASVECLLLQTSNLNTTNCTVFNSGNGGLWIGSYSGLSGNNGFGVNTGSWTFCNAASAFPINKRVHIVGTYDGSNIRIYVDGVLSNTTAKTGNINQGAGSGFIGANSTIGSVGPTGTVTFLKTYSETLSAGEIKNKSAYYKGFI